MRNSSERHKMMQSLLLLLRVLLSHAHKNKSHDESPLAHFPFFVYAHTHKKAPQKAPKSPKEPQKERADHWVTAGGSSWHSCPMSNCVTSHHHMSWHYSITHKRTLYNNTTIVCSCVVRSSAARLVILATMRPNQINGPTLLSLLLALSSLN